jgi:hypothetical protein
MMPRDNALEELNRLPRTHSCVRSNAEHGASGSATLHYGEQPKARIRHILETA